MDGESWQLNLESWRERRRAAAKALTSELQQHYDASPKREAVEHILHSDNDMRDYMRELKTPDQDALKLDAHSVPQRDVYSSTDESISYGLHLTPDVDRSFSSSQTRSKQAHQTKYLPVKLGESEGNDKRPLPMRIRLMCHSDCVKADRMGLSVVALGDNEGPPFFIQDIVKNSMANRGHLEVGDELFSVDNLCCSFVADRPILVPTLAKLHQVLERLTKKQRPVEVKVFRGHGSSNRDGAGSANPRAWKMNSPDADRGRASSGLTNIETTKEGLHKSYALPNGSLNSRNDKNGARRRNVSEDRGITLVEIEKVHPVRGVQHCVPSAERIEASYSDPEIVYTIPPQVEMASAVVTIKSDIELSQAKSPPEVIGVSDSIKSQRSGHSGNASRKNYAELLPPVSVAPTLPLTPPPPLSNWPLPTSPEAHSSVRAISTSPTLELTSSRRDRHPSISLLLTPPPPDRRNFATQPVVEQSIVSEQELYPQLILNQKCRSPIKGLVSAQQSRGAQGVVGVVSTDLLLTLHQGGVNEDVGKRNASPNSTPLPAKVLNAHDSLQTDACHNETHYSSDVSSLDEQVHFEPIPPDINFKSEPEIAESKIATNRHACEDSLLVASDVDNDKSPERKGGKVPKPLGATAALLLRESVLEHKEPIEEVDSDCLPNIVSKEQRCTHHEEYELLEVVTSSAKTETLMAEMVTRDTLQSLEEHADFTASLSPKSFGELGQLTEVRIREDGQQESAHPPEKNAQSLSNRMSGGQLQNRPGSSPIRAPRVNVIGTWYTCAGCNQQLGTSDLMIIEQLSLFYHLSCFVCARCGIQLSDGQNETSVRIRNGLIYCYICYHRISKSLSCSKERNEEAKLKESPKQSDRHPSSARSSANIGQFFNTNSPCQSNGFTNSSKR
ncbi:LIM and calponin homology domains-containing protein 1 [Taenia crassiceps]|uniref:LIM and calponin homology domains-containing protein 1 n=1 Tax=Taenia crassiceps TaxID=6207 RepID=A0ABR4QQW7_9CEST